MPVEYSPAPEVAAIAKRLIHEHHLHLAGERLVYVFRSEHAKDGGKAVFGKARKIGGLNAYLSSEGDSDEDYFVIEMALDIWLGMSDRQRIALVDHELSFLEAASGQLRLLDDQTGEVLPGIVEEAARRINEGELGPNITAHVG